MYGIFTYIWLIFMVNIGEYASPMDPMGTNKKPTYFCFFFSAVSIQYRQVIPVEMDQWTKPTLGFQTPNLRRYLDTRMSQEVSKLCKLLVNVQ